MPSVASTRVKNTGTGEITYSEQDAGSNSAVTATETTVVSAYVTSILGDNIGNGVGVFSGSNGSPNVMLEFKSLQAGEGIEIDDDGQTITITSTSNGVSGGSGAADGYHLVLGNAVVNGDGSWANGAVSLTDNTTVSAAVDAMNELLGMLIPASPTAFPGHALSIINTAGSVPMLAIGVADNANAAISPGTAVSRIITSSVSSNAFDDVGPGNSGTVQVLVNNAIVGSRSLTGSGDNGTYGGLVVGDQKNYPVSQPGFWKSIDLSVAGTSVNTGVNKIKINHTAAGSTNEVIFVRDDMVSNPTISLSVVSEAAQGALTYSSGVPHYNASASLLVGMSFTNLSGETYYGANDPITISGTNGIISTQVYNYGNIGINTPIVRNITTATAITPILVNVDGTNVHGSGLIQGIARNVNGASGSTTLSATNILVMRGAATSKINETSIPVTGLGFSPNNNNAVRVSIASTGNEPTGSVVAWDSTTLLATYEAAVVGGVLSHNQTNYLTGYLPIGPNYSSSRASAQYITLSFNRAAVSTFKINIVGTYAGAWIKLPGVSDNSTISPNATNGWWDATVSYGGAGVPGNSSDPTSGCAAGSVMTGASGSYSITFGPQTSTNANGNTILVRIRLNAGQSVTALSFSN